MVHLAFALNSNLDDTAQIRVIFEYKFDVTQMKHKQHEIVTIRMKRKQVTKAVHLWFA